MKFFRYSRIILLAAGLSFHLPCTCQPVRPGFTDSLSLYTLLREKAAAQNLKLFCDSLRLGSIRISSDKSGLDFHGIFDGELARFGLGYITFSPDYIVIVIKPGPDQSFMATPAGGTENEEAFEPRVYDKTRKYSLQGMVEDGKNAEPLIGATIYIRDLGSGVITNEKGFFSLTLPSAGYHIFISALGYRKENLFIPMVKDTALNINLFTAATQLDEVVVHDEAEDHHVSDISMGVTRLDIRELKHIPPLMGEPDILKSILLMPGVTTTGEGSSGFNVRGGNADQNLILLDDAPIFNPSHLFGFFSAVSSSAISDVTLSKGGIPAQYGGRVSSLVNIKTRQGNNKSIRGEGGVGVLASNLSFDGPLGSDRTTFLFSGRAAYSDWYLNLLPGSYLKNSQAYFHDGIGKITHHINDRNIVSVTGYTSHDKFNFPGDTVYGWNTDNLTLSWSKFIRQKLFMLNELVYSNYAYRVDGGKPESAFTWKAGINYYNVKSDFTYNQDFRNKTDFGYSVIYHLVNAGSLVPRGRLSELNPSRLAPEHGIESALYINQEHIFSPKITLMAGLRFSVFLLNGPGQINVYKPESSRTLGNITGTKTYRSGEIIRKYWGPEPRLSLKFGLDPSSSLKASYNRTRQYIHLISNTAAISPVDIWKLSDPYLRPQVGDQVSVGYFRNLNVWETSLEFYYKHVRDVIDYKDGADLVLNPDLETDLIDGVLRSYGMEVWLRKVKGRLTGSLSYTLSRTERKVSGKFPEESINSGKYYPASYDKLHDLTLTGNYQFTRRHSFGFNFILNSGRPITYPTGSYEYFGFYVPNYELRNQDRIPAYHRLDVSFTIDGNHKKKNHWHGSWTFSVYNLYGRRNPYSVFFRAVAYKLPQAYRLSVIGIPVPSLTYNFKFE